jgi:hypothetical protein
VSMKLKTNRKYELTDNQRAAASAIKFFSALIIVAVVFYCEIMYLGIIQSAFPDGVFRALAGIGAIASGLSVLILVLAKMFWFPDGGQMIFGWIFTAAEVMILVANLLLSFEIHWNNVDSYMATWRDFSPATPVLALVGWVIVWQLDASTKRRQAALKQEEQQHVRELEHNSQVFEAVMDLKDNYLVQTVEYLKGEFSAPGVQAQLKQGARDLAAATLSSFTNIPVITRPGRGEVEGSGYTVGSDQAPRGLPAGKPAEYKTRQQRLADQAAVDESQDQPGLLARMKGAADKMLGRTSGDDPSSAGDDPSSAGDDPATPVEPAAPAPARQRYVPIGYEPSNVSARRRAHRERLRGRGSAGGGSAVPEPVTETVPVAVVPEPEVEPVAPAGRRRKKKLPRMKS